MPIIHPIFLVDKALSFLVPNHLWQLLFPSILKAIKLVHHGSLSLSRRERFMVVALVDFQWDLH